MNTAELAELIAELAQEVDNADPTDWADLSIDETGAYRLMALHVVERWPNEKPELLASMTKLLVENFVLNMRLLKQNG